MAVVCLTCLSKWAEGTAGMLGVCKAFWEFAKYVASDPVPTLFLIVRLGL